MVTRRGFGSRLIIMHPLLLALLISLCAIAETSAQTAPGSAENFSGLLGGRTVSVIDDSGQETKGLLLRFTPEQLTMMVLGREVSFQRQNVTAVYERGNSVKKGVILGLLAGPAIAVASLLEGGYSPYIAEGSLIISGIGLAVGFTVDALIPGKRLIYARAGGPDDFRALASGDIVSVVSNSGVETSGRLLRFTTEELTLEIGDRHRTIARQQIMTIFERGDSIKNGLIIGLVAGGVAGFAKGASKDDCDHTPVVGPAYFTPLDCSAAEKWVEGSKVGGLLGLAGAGIGAAFDKLIVGRRLLYQGQQPAPRATISVAPSLGLSRIGFLTRVSW